MKPIRILHVIQTIHPVESASSRLAVLMAASQAADGHHVRLLTGDSAATMILAEKAFESYDGFRRIPSPTRTTAPRWVISWAPTPRNPSPA